MGLTLCNFKSFEIKAGERILKVEEYGAKTANESSPFGEDSIPLKNAIALFATTANNSEPFIIGYLNKSQLSKVKEGEKRTYSLKPDGSLSIEIYLKNDGKAELGGNGDNLVKFQKLQDKLNNHCDSVNTELLKIATAIQTLGGSYIVQPLQLDILDCKVNELLCP